MTLLSLSSTTYDDSCWSSIYPLSISPLYSVAFSCRQVGVQIVSLLPYTYGLILSATTIIIPTYPNQCPQMYFSSTYTIGQYPFWVIVGTRNFEVKITLRIPTSFFSCIDSYSCARRNFWLDILVHTLPIPTNMGSRLHMCNWLKKKHVNSHRSTYVLPFFGNAVFSHIVPCCPIGTTITSHIV